LRAYSDFLNDEVNICMSFNALLLGKVEALKDSSDSCLFVSVSISARLPSRTLFKVEQIRNESIK
jgi:hypothetical protein